MKDLVVLKAHPSEQAYIEHLRVYAKVEIIGTRKGIEYFQMFLVIFRKYRLSKNNKQSNQC